MQTIRNEQPTLAIVTEANLMPSLDNCEDGFYATIHLLQLRLAQTLGAQVGFSTVEDILQTSQYPDCVYDHLLQYSDGVRSMHQTLTEANVPYVNPPAIMELFASKIKSYQVLDNFGVLQPYTEQFTNSEQLATFLKKRKKAVIKPEWGGMGNKVYFLTQEEEEIVNVEWVEDDCGVYVEHQEAMQANEFFDKFILKNPAVPQKGVRGNIEGSWVIQEFLDLARGRDGVVDLRVIEQRDGEGELKVSLLHGRKSTHSSTPLTNISKGGQLTHISEVLKGTGIKAKDLIDVCRVVDNAVESVTGERIGEVGHDLAVVLTDEGWKIYYIEGNTMPGYVLRVWDKVASPDFDLSDINGRDRKLLSNPLEYMQYLANIDTK